MPCIVCKKTEILNHSDTWGLSDGVCQPCFTRAQSEACGEKAAKDVAADLLQDYGRIFLLLNNDRATVIRCLRALADELGNLEGREGYQPSHAGKGHIKLSAALERYETYCWFPPCGDTFVAQLSSERFLDYLKRGLMAKDPGAGPKHGDFTHRIHWHVVSRVITDGFAKPVRAGWNHSPLKLFTYLGEGPAVTNELWTHLFEKGAPTFRFPDSLNEHICNGDYGALTINMRRRFEKRSRELAPHLDPNVERPNDWEVRKVGEKDVTRQRKAWSYLDSIGTASGVYADKVRAKYQTESMDPVLARKAVPPNLSIASRIAQSTTSFNRDSFGEGGTLTYQQKLGAIRLQDMAGMARSRNLRHAL